jgi:hypothetical protein
MAQGKKFLHFDGSSEEAPKDKDGNYEIKVKSKKKEHGGGSFDKEITVPQLKLYDFIIFVGLLGATLCY